jgi:hypothetical protein
MTTVWLPLFRNHAEQPDYCRAADRGPGTPSDTKNDAVQSVYECSATTYDLRTPLSLGIAGAAEGWGPRATGTKGINKGQGPPRQSGAGTATSGQIVRSASVFVCITVKLTSLMRTGYQEQEIGGAGDL